MANVNSDVNKKKRKRTHIPPNHLVKLENLFKKEPWPNRAKKEELALELGQTEHFVSIWFQNRRARMKREETGISVLEQINSDDVSEAVPRGTSNEQERTLVAPNVNNTGKNVKIVKGPMRLLIKPKENCERKKVIYPLGQGYSEGHPWRSEVLSEHRTEKDSLLKCRYFKIVAQSPSKNISIGTPASAQNTTPDASKTQEPVASLREESAKTPMVSKADSGKPKKSFFQAVISMIAVVEGGIMSPQDPDFPSAANDALYGININGDTRLVYKKDTGLEFIPMAD